jgi:3-dehydroquinate synthase
MKKIQANDYVIELGRIVESDFDLLLNTTYKNAKKIILVDENTHDYCLEFLITTFDVLKEAEVMLLPVGEENKVLEVCFQVWEAMSEYHISRKDLIINLGGGVVSDMGGFVASIYKRGIDFINIPTTLLSMVDASVGGKTGVDLGRFKNQLGTFTNPKGLFVDVSFLSTLPSEEILNGFAEMLKHGLIASPVYWKELTSLASMDDLLTEKLISTSIEIKNKIVKGDPKEVNDRKKLNFGHTIGHGLEGFFLTSNPIGHGHAVAIGMLAESFISYKKGILSEADWNEINGVLTALFPVLPIRLEDIEVIIELMRNDKKNSENEIKSCLLTGIGSCVYDQNLTVDEIKESLYFLIAIQD